MIILTCRGLFNRSFSGENLLAAKERQDFFVEYYPLHTAEYATVLQLSDWLYSLWYGINFGSVSAFKLRNARVVSSALLEGMRWCKHDGGRQIFPKILSLRQYLAWSRDEGNKRLRERRHTTVLERVYALRGVERLSRRSERFSRDFRFSYKNNIK